MGRCGAWRDRAPLVLRLRPDRGHDRRGREPIGRRSNAAQRAPEPEASPRRPGPPLPVHRLRRAGRVDRRPPPPALDPRRADSALEPGPALRPPPPAGPRGRLEAGTGCTRRAGRGPSLAEIGLSRPPGTSNWSALVAFEVR